MGRISMPQGKGSQLHNRRAYQQIGRELPDNIDATKSHENIVLVDMDIRQAYDDIFGEALDEYNARQKRADRKIESYYDHIQKSKNGENLFYEDVVQWGSAEDFQSPQVREKAKNALVQYAEYFEERNPNLRLIGAYIHMDEASPHLHLDYIPVAHGYKNGLKTRNSLDRAMKQMGFHPKNESRKNNATKLWKEHEREVFGEICRGYGLDVEPERKSARASLTVDEYKDAKDKMLGDIEQERKTIIAEVEPLRELKTGIDEISSTGRTVLPGVVAIAKKDLDMVKEQAKAYTVNRDEIETLRERSRAVSQREQHVAQREQQVERMYEKQVNINKVLEATEKRLLSCEEQVSTLSRENSTLEDEQDRLKVLLYDLSDGVRGIYRCLTDIIKAVRMLKYDRISGYKVTDLSLKQSNLIDGLVEYGASLARMDGFPEMAEEMETRAGISKDIADVIDPPQRQDSYDREDEWDMEL